LWDLYIRKRKPSSSKIITDARTGYIIVRELKISMIPVAEKEPAASVLMRSTILPTLKILNETSGPRAGAETHGEKIKKMRKATLSAAITRYTRLTFFCEGVSGIKNSLFLQTTLIFIAVDCV